MDQASATSWARYGQLVALVGAAVIAFTSVLPHWASLEPEPSSSLVILSGSTHFPVWRAYPLPVLLGVVLSGAILAVGLAQLVMGRSRVPSMYLFVAGGAAVLVLLLYGVWEGPQRLAQDPLFGRVVSEGPVSVAFVRGPLLYVGLVAAVMIIIGGIVASSSGTRGRQMDRDSEQELAG